MTTRYVVLVFDDDPDDGHALHSADDFLGRFEEDGWLNADIGAAYAYELAGSGYTHEAKKRVNPPRGPLPRGWLDEIEQRRR